MELTEALNQYEQCFGERYFFYIGFVKSDQEIIEEIENCIRPGKNRKNLGMMRINYIKRVHRWQCHHIATAPQDTQRIAQRFNSEFFQKA